MMKAEMEIMVLVLERPYVDYGVVYNDIEDILKNKFEVI